MEIQKKLLSATLFTSLFKDGRREVKSYDENTKTLKIRNLVTNRDSSLHLGGAVMYARYWDVLTEGNTEYEADSRAIRHGIVNEELAINVIKDNTSFHSYEQQHKFSTPHTSGVIDLCAKDADGNIKELFEVKCPYDKGKKLLYLLNNIGFSSETKEQLVLQHDPAWWGQVQFYLYSLQAMNPKAYLVVFEPLFKQGLNLIRIDADPRVFEFIEAVSEIINDELKALAETINKHSITFIPQELDPEMEDMLDFDSIFQNKTESYIFERD